MALALYLIGAPRTGKTAIFDALTHTPEGPNFTTKSGNRYGTVKVPDLRLEALRTLYKPKKFTPAEVTFVDDAAPAGDTIKFGDSMGLLGNADAFVLVVQAFGEFDYEGKPLDAAAQLQAVMFELIVADLDKVERRLDKIEQEKKRGICKVAPAEISLLERFKEHLEKEQALRGLELREDEEKLVRTYQFLSIKPILAVANVSEAGLDGRGLDALRAAAAEKALELLVFCAPLEADIAQLDAAAQAEFLKDYGLTEPARVRLIQTAYRVLRLHSFFTVGEDEVRAWTISEGTCAQRAAGKIHTDLERGFIRAETVAFEDLQAAGTWAKCRDNATLRLEGKEYVVRDADVINFRFSV